MLLSPGTWWKTVAPPNTRPNKRQRLQILQLQILQLQMKQMLRLSLMKRQQPSLSNPPKHPSPDPRSVMRFPPPKSALQSNASHSTRVPTSPITHESE